MPLNHSPFLRKKGAGQGIVAGAEFEAMVGTRAGAIGEVAVGVYLLKATQKTVLYCLHFLV